MRKRDKQLHPKEKITPKPPNMQNVTENKSEDNPGEVVAARGNHTEKDLPGNKLMTTSVSGLCFVGGTEACEHDINTILLLSLQFFITKDLKVSEKMS